MDRESTPDRDRQLSRRGFLRYTATAGAVVASSSALGALAGGGPALAAEDASAGSHVPRFKWEEATIAELQAAMRAGRLTSRRLVDAYIRRIREIDFSGIQLNSVIEVNPDARTIADEL